MTYIIKKVYHFNNRFIQVFTVKWNAIVHVEILLVVHSDMEVNEINDTLGCKFTEIKPYHVTIILRSHIRDNPRFLWF